MSFYFHAYNALCCQTIILPPQCCEGLQHLSRQCLCILDARLKDVKRLRGQKLIHHNVSCDWLSGHYGSHTICHMWTVTSGKRASNMSTCTTEGRICFLVSTDRTGCFVLLWVVLLICPSSMRSHPPEAKNVVNIWGLLTFLSCSPTNVPCDSYFYLFFDWLRIWPRHIPAP